ncbi:MAG TPA: M6 family metalloprotease domain-containing protein, partial [candidate division Zixibacteria bacterium]|nr:M6 family metalloprotease domain-containing protein [candidate division Zixibacteria bacterium]
MNTMKSAKVNWYVLAILVIAFGSSLLAVPPHPDLMDRVAAAKVIKPYYMEHSNEIHKKGVCQPEHFFKPGVTFRNDQLASPAAAPFRVLAILVKFSDHDSSVSANFFDSLVFGANGTTVRNYYSEISYAQLDMITVNMPSSLGWRTAPQTYDYYVNDSNGFGSYPQNSQKLVEDMVDQIDGLVNFSQYDNDGNGFVDCLLLIHSGTGAEFSGSSSDFWSHKWSITPRQKDGVFISSFTVQPEFWIAPGDMTIGVYAHELGHGFGLPDLYDTDQGSYGIGKWCIMSYGSWNGPYPGGGSPAHPCAWSRIEMGFATATNITSNQSDVDILDVEQNSTIYRLWTSGNMGNEYFLVENRQRTGYDTFLPQSGLLIWHIDDAKAGNTQEWWPGQPNANHYKVALEQADGSFELEHRIDQGDGFDVFPGLGNNTSFDAVSSPNSDAYTLGTSFVGVQNISALGNVINADLIVGFSAGIGDETELPNTFELAQNYPNPFNPYTTISFSLPVNSQVGLEIYNLKGELTASLVNQRLSAGNHSYVWD